MERPEVVLDTNVFVAAGFRAGSASGRVLDLVRQGRLRHVWHEDTARETQRILGMIPRLSWVAVEGLFAPGDRHVGDLDRAAFALVPDAADRKFAALAAAAGAVLVSADEDLLGVRDGLRHLGVTVVRPSQVPGLVEQP
ncbi:PIN domain-containing protein [Novispirillum sp. DQ9]|uniref:PIN domain-containing protein n=1 Tax=Novispirillum sp. DQ9 TaxID=3398612 RepID=UPI003C79E3CC